MEVNFRIQNFFLLLGSDEMAKQWRFLPGQAALALTLAAPMVLGAVCIGADMQAVYSSSVHLQKTANSAVLSGAVYLPADPALAESAARSRAQIDGISEDEIIYDRPAADARSITMIIERKVPYPFLRLFCRHQGLVTVKAVAGIRPFQSGSGVLPIAFHGDAHSSDVSLSVSDITGRDVQSRCDESEFREDRPHKERGERCF
jgi:hypothetical protein